MWWLPLEGAGFEPSVPPISSVVTHGTPARHPRPHFTAGMMMRGTEGSNPPPSSGESAANLLDIRLKAAGVQDRELLLDRFR
jgi:hypothetical protein